MSLFLDDSNFLSFKKTSKSRQRLLLFFEIPSLDNVNIVVNLQFLNLQFLLSRLNVLGIQIERQKSLDKKCFKKRDIFLEIVNFKSETKGL